MVLIIIYLLNIDKIIYLLLIVELSMQTAHKWIQKQRMVWAKALPQYPNPYQDAFLEAKVIDFTDKQVHIELIESTNKVKVPMDHILKLTYGPNDVADMVDLQQLNQPELLFNIKRRYMNDQIFTYCGPTLLIINPYCYIEKLFLDSVLQRYQTNVFTDNLQYKSLPPHIFALAAFCLWQLFDNSRNQSIVISGESGAGKTENTKYCLKFLASLGKNMKEIVNEPVDQARNRNINYQNMRTAERAIKKGSKVFGIEEKILGCNEILEAFGNSKTIRNDNSSRFGKLILLVYGETQIDIKSAFIISYLLEKSRIVSVSDGQRNYHIFYYFCKGTSQQQKKQYHLQLPINKYYYLNQSTTYDLPKVSDEDRFLELKKQFQMYLIPEEIDCVYRVLSIVLNMGNVLFKKGENKNNQEIAIITNLEYIRNITDLLEVDFQKFKHSFQFKTRKTGASVINSPLKFDEAQALRDSLSKNIYEKVFNYLVVKLNQKIEIQKIDFESTASRETRKSIGLLDIFGFEVLLINSLEQFFINFANQKLQQLYVSYIFKEEKNEFLKEGLKQFSHQIGFQDNKPVIDLFELYPLGIFHLINESSELNKPDEDLPEKVVKTHKLPFVSIPKSKKGHFQIDHSCSSVSYNTVGFTAKNKDEFPKQLLEVIKSTKNQYLRKIIVGEEKQEEEGKKKQASTKFLGSKFLSEMNKLTEELYSCDCHFVRCIKPNSKKSPKLFNSEAVLQSLRYLGVLDSIKVRKLGYIYRRPYKQFFKKFYELESYIYSYKQEIQGKSEDDLKQMSRKIIEKYAKKELDEKDILFGSKKILIKQSALNHIELMTKEKRRLRVQMANKIKNMYKHACFRVQIKQSNKRISILKQELTWIVKKARYSILKKKIAKIQNVIQKYLLHVRFERIKVQATKSVTRISAYLKMKKQRKLFLENKKNILKIQAHIRRIISMRLFLKEMVCFSTISQLVANTWEQIRIKKAIIIQKRWKGFKVRQQFKEVIKLMKIRAFIKRALLKFRLMAFSQFLALHKKPIMKLQAIVKARYLRRVYLKVKKSTLIIQKAFRRHLRKKFYLEKAWQNFKNNIIMNQKYKINELTKLGINIDLQTNPKRNIRQTSSLLQIMHPQALRQLAQACINDQSAPVVTSEPKLKELTKIGININLQANPNIRQKSSLIQNMHPQGQQLVQQESEKQLRDFRINQSISFPDKNTIQIYISDVDILSTQTYKGRWFQKYANLKSELAKKQEYPLKIDISSPLTYVTSNREKVYSFGEQPQQQFKEQEEEYQKTQLKVLPRQVCVNDQSVYVVTSELELYEWGNNQFGELFGEKYDPLVGFVNKNSVKSAVNDVEVRGRNRFYCDNEGRVYQKNQRIVKMVAINKKYTISSVTCSYSFTHLLASTGQLFSFGSNKEGQLGIDSKRVTINEPTLNEYFAAKKQIIETISVGLSHSVARTKLGYVYTWGSNKFRQVAISDQECFFMPVSMELNKQKLKVLQAVAGIRATYLLTENFTILGLGTSQSLNTAQKNTLSQIDLLQSTNFNPKNLTIIKLSCSWTLEQSILTTNCLESNKCKAGTKPDVIQKYCKIIAKEWMEKLVYPPYHEWIDNQLNVADLRKFRFGKPAGNTNTKAGAVKKGNENQLEDLKVLMDLRKTSTLFKTAARSKIEQILKKLSTKSPESWTKQQSQLYTYINQNCKAVLK